MVNASRAEGSEFDCRSSRVDSAFHPFRTDKMRCVEYTVGDCCRRLGSNISHREKACRWQMTLCNPICMFGFGPFRLHERGEKRLTVSRLLFLQFSLTGMKPFQQEKIKLLQHEEIESDIVKLFHTYRR
jgi:hypothetical protein